MLSARSKASLKDSQQNRYISYLIRRDQIARRYGLTYEQVDELPVDDVQIMLAIMRGEARALQEQASHAKHRGI